MILGEGREVCLCEMTTCWQVRQGILPGRPHSVLNHFAPIHSIHPHCRHMSLSQSVPLAMTRPSVLGSLALQYSCSIFRILVFGYCRRQRPTQTPTFVAATSQASRIALLSDQTSRDVRVRTFRWAPPSHPPRNPCRSYQSWNLASRGPGVLFFDATEE